MTHLGQVTTKTVPGLKVLSQPGPVAVHGTQQNKLLLVVQRAVQESGDGMAGVVVGKAQVVPSVNTRIRPTSSGEKKKRKEKKEIITLQVPVLKYYSPSQLSSFVTVLLYT